MEGEVKYLRQRVEYLEEMLMRAHERIGELQEAAKHQYVPPTCPRDNWWWWERYNPRITWGGHTICEYPAVTTGGITASSGSTGVELLG